MEAAERERSSRIGQVVAVSAEPPTSHQQDGDNSAKPDTDGRKYGIRRFLEWAHEDTPIDGDVLAQKYAYYSTRDYRKRRDDPAPTWDSLEGDHNE